MDFNVVEAANEMTSEESTESANVEQVEATSQEAETNETENVEAGQAKAPVDENAEVSPEQILNDLAQPNQDDAKATLEFINSLGAIHNGEPIEVSDADQLKELIQKGYDYTKKTMTHSEEVKQKEAEFEQRQQEFAQLEQDLQQQSEQLQNIQLENDVIGSALLKLQANDPDLFAEIQRLYQAELQQVQTMQPKLQSYDKKFQAYEQQLNELRQQNEQKESQGIRENWQTELSDVQGKYAASLNKLGVKPNWDKVRETWAADATGNMSVEQALYATYGAEIQKANESYNKLLQSKKKVSDAQTSRTGVSAGHGGQASSQISKGGERGLYDFLANEAANM